VEEEDPWPGEGPTLSVARCSDEDMASGCRVLGSCDGGRLCVEMLNGDEVGSLIVDPLDALYRLLVD
jgi:hypothetical protein